MSESEDVDLLTAWAGGDTSAGDALLRRHFDRLYLFFATKIDGPVDDLVQGTFLSALESRDRLRDASRFRSYLFSIARNRLIDHYRARGRSPAGEPLTSRVAAADPSPSLVVADGEEQELLLRALKRLSLDQQIALGLHYFQGMKVAEIADATDAPVGTVKYRLSVGRDRLREEVDRIAASPELAQSTLVGIESWLEGVRAASTRSG